MNSVNLVGRPIRTTYLTAYNHHPERKPLRILAIHLEVPSFDAASKNRTRTRVAVMRGEWQKRITDALGMAARIAVHGQLWSFENRLQKGGTPFRVEMVAAESIRIVQFRPEAASSIDAIQSALRVAGIEMNDFQNQMMLIYDEKPGTLYAEDD